MATWPSRWPIATSAPVVADAATPPTTTAGEMVCARTRQSKRACMRPSRERQPANVIPCTCWRRSQGYFERPMHAAAHLTTILVVEDNAELVSLLQRLLGEEGFAVRTARDGDTGLASALENEPDLLILDVGLPHRNGFEVVQELRRKGINAPTLMLTARGDVADRVNGLDCGADD